MMQGASKLTGYSSCKFTNDTLSHDAQWVVVRSLKLNKGVSCVSLCPRQRACFCVTGAGPCHAVHCKVAATSSRVCVRVCVCVCVRLFTGPICPLADDRCGRESCLQSFHAWPCACQRFVFAVVSKLVCYETALFARPLTTMSTTATSMDRSVSALQMHAHSMSLSTALSPREIRRMQQQGSSIFLPVINQLLVNSVDENHPCTTLAADAIHQVVYPICRAAAVVCAAYFSDVAWAFRGNGWIVTKLPCGALTFEAAVPAAAAAAVLAAVPVVPAASPVPAAAAAAAVPAAVREAAVPSAPRRHLCECQCQCAALANTRQML